MIDQTDSSQLTRMRIDVRPRPANCYFTGPGGITASETLESGRCICAKRVQRGAKKGKKSTDARRGRKARRGAARHSGGSAWDTVCAALAAARVSHGHGVHCPEPRPQGHRPTEPIVPLLCSSAHFRRVLLLAKRARARAPCPSTCIMRVRRCPATCRVHTRLVRTRFHVFAGFPEKRGY